MLNKLNIIFILFLFTSCVETPDNKIIDNNSSGNILLLSEGLLNQDNSKLQKINLDSNFNNINYYEQINKIKLGDTANDMILVDDYIYIIISNTNKIIKINKNNGELINSFLFSKTRFIKHIHFNKYLWITDLLNNTVLKLDTNNLQILNEIAVGPGPDGIDSHNNYLFVANSAVGQIRDKEQGARTISVIDINTDLEIQKIHCGPNTLDIEIANNKLYASYANFHWSDSVGAIIEYDLESFNKISEYKTQIHSKLKYYNNKLYFINNDGLNYLDLTNKEIFNQIKNTSTDVWYSFNIDNNYYYILNAFNHQVAGELLIFENQNKFANFPTGINPNTILFLNEN